MRMIDPQNTVAIRGTRHANGAARVSRRATIRAAFAGLVAGWAIQTPRRVGADEAAPSDSAPGMVDIGGRSIALECRGSGGPTVVLVSGYRDTSLVWTIDFADSTPPRTMVMPAVAVFAHTMTYDRPGTYAPIGDEDVITSRSDAIAQPRTATEVVTELHDVLQAAGQLTGGLSHVAAQAAVDQRAAVRRDAADVVGRRGVGQFVQDKLPYNNRFGSQ